MFPKTNNTKNKNQENWRLDEIKADSEDNSILSVGNEGMNSILSNPFAKLLSESNENNNNELDNSVSSYSGMGEKDPESEDENIISTKEKPLDAKKYKAVKKQEEEINREKDPAKIIDKTPEKLLDDLMYTIEDKNPKLDKDLVVERPKRKHKSSNKQKKTENENAAEEAGLEEINEEMEPVNGFNFTPIKLPDRKKPGRKDRFLSGLAWYTGKTLGKLVGLIGNIIYWPLIHVPLKTYMKLSGKGKKKKQIEPELFQKVRRHDLIPGWDGEKFQKPIDEERKRNDPIEVDFRKIPGVWANLIAAEAEDEHGDPLDPIITIYVNEPAELSDDLFANNDIGHTFVGLEFSHFSNRTNRFERYIVKYGLFAPGGSGISSYIAGHYKNARIPAQLFNDENYGYDISRSFAAKPRQVNAIMKASETYADKGYSLYERNCTTFVRDMVVGVAGIRQAENILKPEELKISNALNAGTFLAAGFSANASMGMQNNLKTMAAQEDMSFERMGNKRITKEEYDRYHETKEKGGSWKKIGMSPNSAAENMRRYNASGLGLMNAQSYSGSEKNNGSFSLEDMPRLCTIEEEQVMNVIQEITPITMMDRDKAPQEYLKIIEDMFVMAMPMEELINMVNDEREAKNITGARGLHDYDCVTPEVLREKRGGLMKNIGRLNKLLFKYYKNDKRLHLPVLHLISLLNRMTEYIDEAYNNKTHERTDDSDLGNLREEMMKNSYRVSAGGKLVEMTPSHYESYLQIYKTPEKAITSYSRLIVLQNKLNGGEVLPKDEKAEYAKLNRIEKLALNFDRSHNYMLDKQVYKQQDIDYAFSLGVKEKKNNAKGAMVDDNRTSSGTYKSIFLEKIFGGMRDRLSKNAAEGGIDEDDAAISENIAEWLDNDMTRAVSAKMNGMRMILKGLKRSIDNPDEKKMYEQVVDLFQNDWFARCFDRKRGNTGKMHVLVNVIPIGFGMLMESKDKKFPKLMMKLITTVLEDDKKDSLRSIRQRANNQA